MPLTRFRLGLALGLIFSLCLPMVANADEGKESCLEAFAQAQRLRREGKLLQSRAQSLRCAQAGCPSAVISKCSEWIKEIDAEAPRLVVAVKEGEQDVLDAAVFINGRRVKNNGRSLQLDPGPVEIRVTSKGRVETRRLLLRVGEGTRALRIRFEPLGRPKSEPQPGVSAASILMWSGFGVGLVGLGVGGVTGALAFSQASDLRERCTNGLCDAAEQDSYEQGLALAHVSTATFAIGGVGAVLGVVGLMMRPTAEPSSSKARLRFQPVAHGAWGAWVGGAF